ncbi:MAG TPA: hypothetical protein VLM85_14485 [Polyangiaceae bacterium]|nr:hypothetical protein [Polyangiaceae bacterium]
MNAGDHPADGARARESIPAIAILVVFVAWSILWNVIGSFTFGWGPLTFACIAGTVVSCEMSPAIARRLAPRVRVSARVAAIVFAFVTLAWMVWHGVTLSRALGSGRMVDVGLNTLEAGRRFFDLQGNPYATRCQLLGVAGAPHVTYRGGNTLMFGVPYYYGYPYYPVQFLVYEPARILIPGIDGLRWANVAFLVSGMGGAFWLAARLAPRTRSLAAGSLAVSLTVGIWALGFGLFRAGLTDFAIAVLVVYGFLAMTYERHATAGALFALALGCKLLPGALLVPIVGVWYVRHATRQARWRCGVAAVVTLLVTVVPFVVWNPAAFLSATTLYYLTKHAAGDDTSLYWFVPSFLRLPFLMLGLAIVVTMVARRLRPRAPLSIVDLVALAFTSSMVVTAFNKMIHLNYFWAVLPLGAVAVAVRLCASDREGESAGRLRAPCEA